MALIYFTDANSAVGYVNLQKENLTEITKIYHLKSPDERLVHNILEQLSLVLNARHLVLEYIYSTFNPDFLAGLIIRELDMAFTSGKEVSDDAEIVDLISVYDGLVIEENAGEIELIRTKMNQFYKRMYMHLNVALHIHDEWESIYIDRMDFEKANQFKRDFITRLFDTEIPANGRGTQLTHRFFGAMTPDGIHDFIPELTAGLTRYLIKGRPGSGKSTLMRGVLKKAVELGYDVDIYYCSLDPKSLDMVVVPELHFCVFDATAPHEYEAVFAHDEVVDTYTAFIREGTDERCEGILEEIKMKYKNQIKLALVAMQGGHLARAQLSDIYADAVVLERLDSVLEGLVGKL